MASARALPKRKALKPKSLCIKPMPKRRKIFPVCGEIAAERVRIQKRRVQASERFVENGRHPMYFEEFIKPVETTGDSACQLVHPVVWAWPVWYGAGDSPTFPKAGSVLVTRKLAQVQWR